MEDTEIEKLKSAYSLLKYDDTAGAEILFALIELLESGGSTSDIADLFDFRYTN